MLVDLFYLQVLKSIFFKSVILYTGYLNYPKTNYFNSLIINLS